ncbi:hypothetical protein ACOSQ3_025411 [Xanthoceras sorbifolium]
MGRSCRRYLISTGVHIMSWLLVAMSHNSWSIILIVGYEPGGDNDIAEPDTMEDQHQPPPWVVAMMADLRSHIDARFDSLDGRLGALEVTTNQLVQAYRQQDASSSHQPEDN